MPSDKGPKKCEGRRISHLSWYQEQRRALPVYQLAKSSEFLANRGHHIDTVAIFRLLFLALVTVG